MLQISSSTPQPQLTASLRRAKLYARSNGDRESAVVAAAYAAKKHNKTYWVYQGNSFGHQVWISDFRRSNALNAINNTGGYLYEITPELEVTLHEIDREEFSRNASGVYYVWVLRQGSDEPLSSEGPYGPMGLKVGEQNARIGATKGIHDRAVSRGHDPESSSFRIERRYQAKSGRRLI